MNLQATAPSQTTTDAAGIKILVVDDQPMVLELLREVLLGQNYRVLTASNGEKALEVYQEERPSFTLTDISMPGMTGLELLRQIKSVNSEAAVMLMTGAGSESFAVEALRGGAINYFNKPIDIHELISTLNRYSVLATGYDFEHYALDILSEEGLSLVLRNDLGQVNSAVQLITNHCRAIFPVSEIYPLRFGLYEMLVNAVEHGNLAITYEEKTAALESNSLTELMRRRAEEPQYRDRRVRVTSRLSPEGFFCTIQDQGAGFDHSVYSEVSDPTSLFEKLGASLHGRGIILTCIQFDQVTFNAAGNEVSIVKRTTPKEA